ncbi:MAG: sialate O-acetylesterase, partial [Saprospiraceae bacterium]|nr:sialate O-acetylesterase [Saprospiraceae bacterium]
MRNLSIVAFLLILCCPSLKAEVKLPAIFGDHMVLQREQTNPVWGWAEPGEMVKVQIHHQTHSAVADEKGRWSIKLRPIP